MSEIYFLDETIKDLEFRQDELRLEINKLEARFSEVDKMRIKLRCVRNECRIEQENSNSRGVENKGDK